MLPTLSASRSDRQADPDQFLYRTQEWCFEPSHNRLTDLSTKEIHPLGAQDCAVLMLLCQHAGQVVSRDHFIEQVWEGNFAVGDRGLRQALWRIRQTLPVADAKSVIVTVPRKGYRLAAEDLVAEPIDKARLSASIGALPGIALAIVAAAVAALMAMDRDRDELEFTAATPVPPFNMESADPAISPDGQRLAFTGREGDLWVIYVVDTDSNEVTNTVQNPTPMADPVFSPDSSRLAFLRTENAYQAFPEYQLVIRNLAEEAESTVARVTGVQVISPGLDWSHDGRFLLFSQATRGNDMRPVIIRLDLESGKQEALTQPEFADITPRFLPGSLDFSFVRLPDPTGGDLYAMIDGELQRLTTAHSYVDGHSWLDGQRFIISLYDEGKYRSFLGRRDEATLRKLEFDPGFRHPTFHRGILYWSKKDYLIGLAVLPLDRPEDLRFLDPNGKNRLDPSFHPFRPRLAYSDDQTGFHEIWSSGLDGSNPRQITDAETRLIIPVWSPDGTRLLARLDNPADPPSRPVLIRAEDGKVTELPELPGDLGSARFSHDGSAALAGLAVDNRTELWLVPLGGKEPPRLIFENGRNSFPVAAERIAVSTEDSAWLVDLRDGSSEEIGSREFRRLELAHQGGYEWRETSGNMQLVRYESDDLETVIVTVEAAQSPGYGFMIDHERGYAAWNRYAMLRKRIYRADLEN